MCNDYLKEFTDSIFWTKMQTSLLWYDFHLKKDMISFAVCDQFYDGVYLPDTNKIILCSNALFDKNDFDNAL